MLTVIEVLSQILSADWLHYLPFWRSDSDVTCKTVRGR